MQKRDFTFFEFTRFHPCDTVLVVTGYGPVCVTNHCSVKLAGWIELVFGMEASFDPSCCVL